MFNKLISISFNEKLYQKLKQNYYKHDWRSLQGIKKFFNYKINTLNLFFFLKNLKKKFETKLASALVI